MQWILKGQKSLKYEINFFCPFFILTGSSCLYTNSIHKHQIIVDVCLNIWVFRLKKWRDNNRKDKKIETEKKWFLILLVTVCVFLQRRIDLFFVSHTFHITFFTDFDIFSFPHIYFCVLLMRFICVHCPVIEFGLIHLNDIHDIIIKISLSLY